MALRVKSDGFKLVPWFSLSEWHDVYKQIYSNDTEQQTRGYEMLLVWKSRMPKLPVGIECTLSLIQVCLRDRSWSQQINSGALPMYHENDLSLMYSTTIMRFLNHISNIGPTKQTSLFQIAKQLRIPEWIVNLRHDTAHGHELPPITLLRMASNILLIWLNDEYWVPEAQALDQALKNQNDVTEIEVLDSQEDLVDLIELWMSVGLYVESDLSRVSDLPDEHLRNILKDIHPRTKASKRDLDTSIGSEHLEGDTCPLKKVRFYLLTEITNHLHQSKDQKCLGSEIANLLVNSQIFLVAPEIAELFSRKREDGHPHSGKNLPRQLIIFWQPMISLLHEAKLLETLIFKLIEVMNSDEKKSSQTRKCASLWLKCIGQSFLKLKIAHKERDKLEHSQGDGSKKTPLKGINKQVEWILNTRYRELRDCPWLGVNSDVPSVFTDESFVEELMINANQYSNTFIGPFLELITPEMSAEKKSDLLELLAIQSAVVIDKIEDYDPVVHTVHDLERICGRGDAGEVNGDEGRAAESEDNYGEGDDEKATDCGWRLAPSNYNWGDCAFGLLPWQKKSMATVSSTDGLQPEVMYPDTGSEIIPGILNDRKVSGRRVKWESVLRTNQSRKRKRRREADKVMDKAIQIVKSRKF
ncbi:ribosomal biogenesis protein LAS1L [Diachasmimorpha longicaudata]|uniref:ribosomal biogenesis protein LAS1L n=1 Tax=Diachasmimorpha longicaudata TaxID=58733 RepID=UPI0030B8939F